MSVQQTPEDSFSTSTKSAERTTEWYRSNRYNYRDKVNMLWTGSREQARFGLSVVGMAS